MLSRVLRSPRAVQVNIAIIRAFVRLREMLLTNANLARKLADLERKYDSQFKAVFNASATSWRRPNRQDPKSVYLRGLRCLEDGRHSGSDGPDKGGR
jgi:hypothetical protein